MSIINRRNLLILNRAYFISFFNMKTLNGLESCKAFLSLWNKFRQIHKQLPINFLTQKTSNFKEWRMAQVTYTKRALKRKKTVIIYSTESLSNDRFPSKRGGKNRNVYFFSDLMKNVFKMSLMTFSLLLYFCVLVGFVLIGCFWILRCFT